MDVSIIIINYNTFQLTCNCIESVYKHTKDISFEIILVDNASTEKDPEEFKKFFPEIKLVKSDKNLGFAKGNNLGISVATGEYILLLNSDTELTNNSIHIVKKYLDNNPDIAVASSKLVYPDGKIQHTCQRFPSVKVKLFELLRLQKILPKQISGKFLMGSFFDHESQANPDWVWGAFFMFKKTHLDFLENKKLDDSFFMYGEDMLWCKEFQKFGLIIGYEPQAVVIHFLGQSGAPRKQMMIDNHEIFMNKYYSKFEKSLIEKFEKLLT